MGQDEIDVAALADVTLVVLVPGTGDDVQAIKAGIMEIADIFVINKADHPGADQTEREIQAMLSLGHGDEVPIFRTIAIDGTGIPELADALQTRPRRTREYEPATWSIDHLGIAVRSIDEALPFYADHMGLPVLSRETVEHEKVKVAMLPAGQTARIELLEPLDADLRHREIPRKARPGTAPRRDESARSSGRRRTPRAAGVRLLDHRNGARAGTFTSSFIRPVPVAYYGNLFRNRSGI